MKCAEMKCSKRRKDIPVMRFKQIITGTYDGTYSIIALGEDGRVYKYRHSREAWVVMSMEVVDE